MSLRVVLSCGKADKKAMRYARALEAAGLEAVMLAPPDRRSLAEIGAAGVVLSGGTDVDAALYGEEPAPEAQQPDRKRDRMEARLLREALQRDLPVLGICRGLQFLNVFHGGTLQQHHPNQPTHRVHAFDRSLAAHDVILRPGTRLASILGESRCPVNSRHHQAAARVPYQLAISARAPDGMVEGLERKDKAFVVAVQWHPEDMVNDARQRRLFTAFGDAVRDTEVLLQPEPVLLVQYKAVEDR